VDEDGTNNTDNEVEEELNLRGISSLLFDISKKISIVHGVKIDLFSKSTNNLKFNKCHIYM
jgi:hypothetical protein